MNSYAPMLQETSPGSGRSAPRWSVVMRFGGEAWSVHSSSGIASIDRLFDCNAMVSVGPPLLLRPAGSSSGSVLLWLPVAAKPHELSSLRL